MILDCPRCGTTQEVMVWSSLNADVSPEARARLLDGKINLFECETCEQAFPIEAALLYHDMKRRFVVRFREPDNPHDPRAVAIYYQDDRIGYVPRDQNREIAARLDQGAQLACQIVAINSGEDAYDAIEVEFVSPAE